MSKIKPIVLKTIIAGDGGVGKTTLLHRYVEGTFMGDTLMTIGVEFHLKECIIGDNHCLLQIWDFGGQDRFRFLLKNYAKGAKGALLLFDLTRPNTLKSIKEWVEICRGDNPLLPILFVGSKSDLKDSLSIGEEHIAEHQNDHDFFDFIHVSSKSGENVELAFEKLAAEMIRTIRK